MDDKEVKEESENPISKYERSPKEDSTGDIYWDSQGPDKRLK